MKNIDRIINHPLFIMSMKKIHDYEIDRVFCCHGIEHSLDVARVAYIANLEQNLGFQKEMIYAAALLHDIGDGDSMRRIYLMRRPVRPLQQISWKTPLSVRKR